MSNDAKQLADAISEILKEVSIPNGRSRIMPFFGSRTVRGKVMCVIGYTWCRQYSHYATGLVYERILASGETYQDAINKARRKYCL